MKALILAGGYGKRLRPYTDNTPKPLLEVSSKPIMIWQFEWLKSHGIDEIVVCAGYLKEKLIEKVGNGSRFGVKVGYAIEEEPLGKGGAIKNSEHLLRNEDKFLVINGDVITNIDPKPMLAQLDKGFLGCIAVTQLPSPYGIVKYDVSTKHVQEFLEKPKLRDYWINAGIYAFTSKIFDYLPDKGEIEETTFPKLARKRLLAVSEYPDALWVSVDSHKDLEEAAKTVGHTLPK
jgi:mannose-1-phosphate guanylyltransferase